MLPDNPLTGRITSLKAYLDIVVAYYRNNACWGSYSYEANTGAANTDYPFPALAGYMLPYCYYYYPIIAGEIATIIASTARTTINSLSIIESTGACLNHYALVCDYYPTGDNHDDCLATGLAISQEFVDNAMTGHGYLPSENYNIATKAVSNSSLDSFHWHAVLAPLVYFLKDDATRMAKIESVETHLEELSVCMPTPVTKDTGVESNSTPYDVSDAQDAAALEAVLNCYAITKDSFWLDKAVVYADRILTYYWNSTYKMFTNVNDDGTAIALSDTTGYLHTEGHTNAKNLAILYQLGQITAAEFSKATKAMIHRAYYRHNGAMERIGYGEKKFNSNYTASWAFRPEFSESCVMLYSVTGDDMWLRYALDWWERAVDLAWSTNGPARAVNLTTKAKTDMTVPEWLFEFATIPIAYEKLTGTTYADHLCTTFATPYLSILYSA